jgi:enamine deaminase RidA (YjgF/YER057c/UK114 family)
MKHVNPESLPPPRGFNHGMLSAPGGRVLFVAGQVAMDNEGKVAGGFTEQFARALDNVLAVVHDAGGRAEQIGRMTVYVTDLAEYRAVRRELKEIWRRRFHRHYPAMALLEVNALVDEGALVEIEATAVLD